MTQYSRQSQHTHDGEPPIVAAQNLTKVFKDFWLRDRARAVDGIDFRIDRGEIFGLLGPNGSGKSTTIKLILGLLKKTRGRLSVFGRAPTDVSIKKRIGYLPEESYLYPFLNARETLDYYGKLFQIDYRIRRKRTEELLDMVGLAGVAHRQVREYSKGMQRRIGIAQALINDPEFLILDEPTAGLDPIGTRQMKDLIIELGRRGKTVLLSSHLLADVEDVVSRMVILYGGRIRAEGTCDDLLTAETRSIIETDALDGQTLRELESFLGERHHRIARVSKPRQKLEELFLDIVEQARREHIATSGAMHGGQTASFLRAEGEDERGEALIDSLIAPGPDVEPAPGEAERGASASAPEAPAADESESVIEELVEPESEPLEEIPSEKPQRDEAAPGGGEQDVDEDVISSLLGSEGDRGSENEKRG